jgi:hypothetical protein
MTNHKPDLRLLRLAPVSLLRICRVSAIACARLTVTWCDMAGLPVAFSNWIR